MEEEYKGKFIGSKKIDKVAETQEKTSGDFPIMEVHYEDMSIEYISSLMFKEIVSEKSCDDSQLRDKRISPIVKVILTILRDWGIKVGELQYMSSLLNQSLDFNQKEALIELLSKWMPKPNSLDEMDFMTIDRILKNIKKVTLNDFFRTEKH